MPGSDSVSELTREFFRHYPDFALCRTLAMNIQENITTRERAVQMLLEKARAAEENREEIEASLDRRTVKVKGRLVRIRDLSLRQILQQEDEVLREIADFYFKHPYAHGRIKRTRLIPRWLRTVFLSALLGSARRRGLDLDYQAFLEMNTLL